MNYRTYTSLIIMCLLNITYIYAQNTLISLSPDYQNQSFYSMQNGETQNISAENWDIAFSVTSMSSAIRINAGKGVKLYSYIIGDTTDWNNINANSIGNIGPELYNSETSWGIGAFNQHQTSQIDLGWGIYSMITHHVVGDSLYLIETINGNWKKLWIKKLASGIYTFRHANLDGSNDILQTIDKNNYNNKNFIYYSIDNNSIEDNEPINTNWDITFTRYITDYPSPQGGTVPYPVTGVLINNGVEVAKATGISSPMTYTDYSLHNFVNEINVIGYDWKSYQGTYIIDASRCYFLRDLSQNIWRLVFTSFDGMSTGNIEFNSTLLNNSTNTKNLEGINTFNIYPNPTTNKTTLIYDIDKESDLYIYDLSGKAVYKGLLTNNGLNKTSLPTTNLNEGVYFIVVSNNQDIILREKLVVQ